MFNRNSRKRKTRKFLKISSVPAENEIYTTLSKYDYESFIFFVLVILNTLYPKRRSGFRGIIIDIIDIKLI
jgi:hypothetical protein